MQECSDHTFGYQVSFVLTRKGGRHAWSCPESTYSLPARRRNSSKKARQATPMHEPANMPALLLCHSSTRKPVSLSNIISTATARCSNPIAQSTYSYRWCPSSRASTAISTRTTRAAGLTHIDLAPVTTTHIHATHAAHAAHGSRARRHRTHTRRSAHTLRDRKSATYHPAHHL